MYVKFSNSMNPGWPQSLQNNYSKVSRFLIKMTNQNSNLDSDKTA